MMSQEELIEAARAFIAAKNDYSYDFQELAIPLMAEFTAIHEKAVLVPQPHRCPVCGGRGLVPFNFYTGIDVLSVGTGDISCRSCDGKGIVWG